MAACCFSMMAQLVTAYTILVLSVLILASSYSSETPIIESNTSRQQISGNGHHHRQLVDTTTTTTRSGGGLCVVGCSPYVDLSRNDTGLNKYRAMIYDMAKQCQVMVHIGDTKSGRWPCNRTALTYGIREIFIPAARAASSSTSSSTTNGSNKVAVLYSPGDNEMNDCHHFASAADPSERQPSELVKAHDAREAILLDLGFRGTTSRNRDLTGQFVVISHTALQNKHIPGTNTLYSCEFDKYLEMDTFALATMEVPGSHWYLEDERQNGYPNQDKVDPLKGRLYMYLNALDCTTDWIAHTASMASANGKRVLFYLFHAVFSSDDGSKPLDTSGIGNYYNADHLMNYTKALTGTAISDPYQPLFDQLTKTAFAYPDLHFYVVHGDGHRYSTVRLNPNIDNRNYNVPNKYISNHNMMVHQVEGNSRAMTMFSRFLVDEKAFQPVTVQEVWSRTAYETEPYGHTYKAY